MSSKSPTKRKPNKATARTTIAVQGARVHNLKNISVEIPRDKLIVVTGLSGSGKSSLAFDTIYAEGQRRYMESLSSFAKRFVAQVAKPDVQLRLRPIAGHLHRAKDHRQQSALDRRHHDRHCQLLEPAVFNHRRAALSTHRRADAHQDVEPDPRGNPVASGQSRDRAARAVFKVYGEELEFVLTEVRKKGCRRLDHRRQTRRHLRASRAR